MYSVLIALLAIAAYHSGLKNPELSDIYQVVAGGKDLKVNIKPTMPPIHKIDECEPQDLDCQYDIIKK
jgi:hypothetical protein